ncbi:MAG: V-type ATP synthase subunit E [Lachnospiraceae bacterium]|nr:V-type ATP synthase subunit E [Lachnospiraceae bacterium]
MAGLDKILDSIKAESDEAVAKRINNAKAEAEALKKEAEASVKDECAQIEARGRRQADDTISRAESAAALLKRKAVLAEKQAIIAEVFDEAEQKLTALPEDRYFDTIMKIAVKNALPEDGRIIFSAADRKRLPSGFESSLNGRLSKGSLKVSDETIDTTGGFVLSYGGIEQNCTFKALIDAEREKLTDKVTKVLFGGTEA